MSSIPKAFLFKKQGVPAQEDIIVISIILQLDNATILTPKHTSSTVEQAMATINDSCFVIYKDDEKQIVYCFDNENLDRLRKFLEEHDKNATLVDATEEFISVYKD